MLTMQSDIGLGINMPPPSPTGVKGAHSRERAKTLADTSTIPRRPRMKASKSTSGGRESDTARAHSLVLVRSSNAMAGLLRTEAHSVGEKRSAGLNLREGKRIDSSDSNDSARSSPPKLHRTRGTSLDQGLSLTRRGTLLSASQASPTRRAAELSTLLGNSSSKVKSGATVASVQDNKTKSKTKKTKSKDEDVVSFEQGRSRVRVALDIDLESNTAVEGGCIPGTLSIRVRPKKKGQALKVGGGKIRIAGFEVAPKNEERCIFYQVSAALSDISNGCEGLYKAPVDEYGFGDVGEGTYNVGFELKVPNHGTGGKPRGPLNARAGAGAEIKYILIASLKVIDPATGKRSISHFYRDCTIWPALPQLTTLAPAPEPMIARASKRLFMGGAGALQLAAALHRCTWVAGQPVSVRLRVENGSKKAVRSVMLALVRTTTLFRGRAAEEGEGREGETCEKRVAEVVLGAGQKAAKGHASAKGWWTGIAPGETRSISHCITIPPDALTIPRARLIEVDYSIRVALGVSSLAGTSEAIHVTLPIRIVNFISLDPPPSGPFDISSSPSSSRSVSELDIDTPRPGSHISSGSGSSETCTVSVSESSLDTQYSDISKNIKKGKDDVIVRQPFTALPTMHTLHDLGSVEDADDLNGVLGDIPGSTSILEESDITMDSTSHTENGFRYSYSSAFSRSRRSYAPDETTESSGYDDEESYDDVGAEEVEVDDVGSDEELERMVGCASARVDGGAFLPRSRTTYWSESAPPSVPSKGTHEVHSESDAKEGRATQRLSGPRAVRGPRSMRAAHDRTDSGTGSRIYFPRHRDTFVKHQDSSNIPHARSEHPVSYIPHTTYPSDSESQPILYDSPESMYSTATHSISIPHMSSTPSKSFTPCDQARSRIPPVPTPTRPSGSRALTAPRRDLLFQSTSARNNSSNLPTSTTSTTQTITIPSSKCKASQGQTSPVRARIALLEQKTREAQQEHANTDAEFLARQGYGYVSRSVTMGAVPLYT